MVKDRRRRMPAGRPALTSSAREIAMAATHEVANQSPPYGGVNLFAADPLLDAAAAGFPDEVRGDLADSGAFWGSHEARELAALANRHAPELERYDAKGYRIDQVVFH